MKTNTIKIGNQTFYDIASELYDYIKQIEQENKQLKGKWEQLKQWLEKQIEEKGKSFDNKIDDEDKILCDLQMRNTYQIVLSKINKLEEGKE